VDLTEIAPGLWRWTAPHPAWRPGAEPGSPGDWEPDVGCVLYEARDAAVFIDPLLPPDPEPLWRKLDERVRRIDRAFVLTTIAWHRRSRDAFVERYGATTSRAKRQLPAGVEAYPVRRAREVIYWLPELRALVPGDLILGGSGGGLRLCPEPWLGYVPGGITVAEVVQALRPLLDLPVDLVLTSHGPPVLGDGRAELARAVAH
jgi:glyoxylase-like metal-dependent hydrolase (beta-lactamase superfamily II)